MSSLHGFTRVTDETVRCSPVTGRKTTLHGELVERDIAPAIATHVPASWELEVERDAYVRTLPHSD